MVQITKAFSDSSRLRYWRICTTALMPEENIMPRIRITMMSLILDATAPTISSTAAAPIHAAPAMPSAEAAVEIPKSGAPSRNSATPNDAPELMPST